MPTSMLAKCLGMLPNGLPESREGTIFISVIPIKLSPLPETWGCLDMNWYTLVNMLTA